MTLRNQMKKNSIVMVLDCGGGTVDITVHKLLCEPHEKFLCQELIPSSGGCEWGSKYVDLYFEEFLKDFFSIYTKNALARLDILRDFEILKRKFKGTKDERSMIKLSYLGEDLTTAKLSKLIQEHNSKNPPEFALKLKGSANVELPSDLMCSFFQPLFENIKNKVHLIFFLRNMEFMNNRRSNNLLIKSNRRKKKSISFSWLADSPKVRSSKPRSFEDSKLTLFRYWK